MPLPKTVLSALLAVACGLISACGPTTEAPTEAGKPLTAETLALLDADRSLAGHRVAITGYLLMCNLERKYREEELVEMEVHTTGSCKSPRIAAIRITLKSEGAEAPGFMTAGPRARNALMVSNKFNNQNITFLTDDYKVVPVKTPVRVSGLVSYPYGMSNDPRLEAVSLNAASL